MLFNYNIINYIFIYLYFISVYSCNSNNLYLKNNNRIKKTLMRTDNSILNKNEFNNPIIKNNCILDKNEFNNPIIKKKIYRTDNCILDKDEFNNPIIKKKIYRTDNSILFNILN